VCAISTTVAAAGLALCGWCATAAHWVSGYSAIAAALSTILGFSAIFVWGMMEKFRAEESTTSNYELETFDPANAGPTSKEMQRRGYRWMVFGPMAWAVIWAVAARDWSGAALLIAVCAFFTMLCCRAVDYSPWRHTWTIVGSCLIMACFTGPFIAIKWPQWVDAFGGHIPPAIANVAGFIFFGIYATSGIGALIISAMFARRSRRTV